MSKKVCGICGNKIGILENYIQLKDGYMCSNCAKSLGLITATGVPTEKWSQESLIDDFKETNTADNNVTSNEKEINDNQDDKPVNNISNITDNKVTSNEKEPNDNQNDKQANNISQIANIKCSFCNKKIEPNDIALAFKDGRMCNDCAKKYNLLQADGYPSAKVMNYCLNHTVEEFKNWIKSSQELGTINCESKENYFDSYVKKHSKAVCAICGNGTDNYLRFKDNSVVCIDCGKKYGLTDENGDFSATAKTYVSNHTVSEFKKMLEDYGEFRPKEVQLEKSPSPSHSREEYRSKNSGNNDKHSIFYYIGVVVVVIVCFNLIRSCSNSASDDSSDSQPKTHKVSKKQSSKKKLSKKQKEAKAKKQSEKKFELKDSQKAMDDDLGSSGLSSYVTKIKYEGDGNADIVVSDNFVSLSSAAKTEVAKKVNNLVIEDAEDFGMEEDPYAFLTFVQTNLKLVGHSKYFSHNEYTWK